jgi:beta-glucosidase
MDIIRTPLDFLGVNCYSRSIVSTDAALNDVKARKRADPDRFAALDMEIYPPSIYNACRLVHDRYDSRIPIYITENGCPMEHSERLEENLHDAIRIRYLDGYLPELHRAIAEGIPVKGYYLWSLLDNFEWAQGYGCRCGILHVDYKTQKRTWKDSAHWYRRLIERNGL